MKLTKEQITKINELAPYDYGENEQGVFIQPYGIPIHIKESVIYMRWNSSGIAGGSCYNTNNYHYENDEPEFKVLDLVLKELNVNVTFAMHIKIQNLIQKNYNTEYEYYSNCDDYEIKFIVLSELLELLEKK